MLKKVIIPTMLLATAAGGVWLYSANCFEAEAQLFLENLKQFNPSIKIDNPQIHKYTFCFSIDTIIVTVPGGEKAIEITLKEPQIFGYNPLTKTLSVKGGATNETTIKTGDEAYSFKRVSEGSTPSLKITFKNHPLFSKGDILDAVNNIREVATSYGKMNIINTKDDKTYASADSLDSKVSVHLPEGATDSYEINSTFNYKNLILYKDTLEFAKSFIKPLMSDAELEKLLAQAAFYFDDKPGSNSLTLEAKTPKEEVLYFIDHLSNKRDDNLSIFPSLKFNFASVYSNSLQEGSVSANGNYEKSSGKLKADFLSSGKISSAFQKVYTTYATTLINQLFSNESKMGEETVAKLMPDFTSWSPYKWAAKVDGTFKGDMVLNDLDLALSINTIELLIKGGMKGKTSKGHIKFVNHKELLNNLKEYLLRVNNANTPVNAELAQSGFTKEVIDELIKSYSKILETVFEKVGKPVKEAKVPTVSFDIIYDGQAGVAKVNDKPVEEILTALAP